MKREICIIDGQGGGIGVAIIRQLGEILGESSPETPCAVVFWAGYPDRQRVVRGTVADMAQKLANEKERFMGLLFMGEFLEDKPYEAAIKLQNNEK